MKKIMKKAVCLAMVLTLAVSLAGCGKSQSSGAMKVKVGTGNAMPPYCSLDDKGEPVGYDVAVLKEIDKRLDKYEFDIQSMDFNTLIVSIDSGALDVVSHQLVKSDARKEKYLFPEQYYCLSPMSLCVRKDSGIKTLADMAGKSINQSPTSYEYSMLMAYNEKNPGKEIKINAVSDLSTADGFKQVSNGQVDASLTYQSTYDSVQKELNLDNLTLTDVVMVEDTSIMCAKGKDDLNTAIDGALKDMAKDGTLSKLSAEYLGQDVFSKYADMVSITAK
ncbi:transporter substrate-binding domain-containing protein [Clostridium sp. Marseille-P2415]|uniref:transporter substrate-binding domain-containing protein n=1 Tax=Clostridium sp. Marseille-P2415 TaxID=1805471 RepID=UPI0013564CA1|nr:transporter substrate-binding domain-containing protein [Clostridium sp. Marseille-P2415]